MSTASTPGYSWSNPIWHGKWRIYAGGGPYGHSWNYVHDDYDGTEDGGDHRSGYEETIDECKAAIAEYEDEHSSEIPAAIGFFLCMVTGYFVAIYLGMPDAV